MNIFFTVPVTTKQVIKVRLVRKDSSLDLNDPAVMEQMLKEVNHVGPFFNHMHKQTTTASCRKLCTYVCAGLKSAVVPLCRPTEAEL